VEIRLRNIVLRGADGVIKLLFLLLLVIVAVCVIIVILKLFWFLLIVALVVIFVLFITGRLKLVRVRESSAEPRDVTPRTKKIEERKE
jgi:Ca2+/Na+ antiporter